MIALEDGVTAHVYRLTDMPRLPNERNPPPLQDVAPVVTYGNDASPDAEARSSYAQAASRSVATPVLTARTAEVTAGLRGDFERAAAIHRFVHDAISDGPGSTDPTGILLRGRGPRFYLEVAMLQAAGVPYDHAVVARTQEDLSGAPVPFFLGEQQYEVTAVRVAPGDGPPFWLFADSPRYYPPGEIPADRLRAPGLLLAEGGAEPVRLPGGSPVASTGFEVRAVLQLEQDGRASMKATGRLRGAIGFQASEQMRTAEDNVRNVVARQVVGRMFEGWTITDAKLTGLTPPGQPLQTRAVLSKGRALESAGDRLLLNLPLTKTEFLATMGDRAERRLPMRLDRFNASSWEVAIDPGDHYRFTSLPAPVRVRHHLIDFSLTYRRDSHRVIVRREVVQHPGTVAPSQFAEWLDLLRKLDLAEDANLELAPHS